MNPMVDADLRSKRLEWIRDGSNWLVGFAAGALVLSGTYFHDHFAHDSIALRPLVASWVLLTASILAGVFTYFAAWKDLRDAPILPAGAPPAPEVPLGTWVRYSYTAMMWTFLLGYLLLALALILNSVREVKQDVKALQITVPLSAGMASVTIAPLSDSQLQINVKGGTLNITSSAKAAKTEPKP